MEPVPAELLMALATGTAGAAGTHAWRSLVALVRRGREQTAPAAGTPIGELELAPAEAELVVLQQEPSDRQQAQALAVALTARARMDAEFAAALNEWHAQTQKSVTVTGSGNVSITISGENKGTAAANRDVAGGVHIGPPVQPTSPPEQPGTSAG